MPRNLLYQEPPPPGLVRGKIANTPASSSAQLFVTIPSYPDPTARWGPVTWRPRGLTLPANGADCLLGFDDAGVPWLVEWAGAYSTLAPIPANPWTVPTLSGAWTAGPGLGYFKDPLGIVRFRGSLKSGASATTAFTLPPGLRPGVSDFWPGLQSSGAAGAFVSITTAGAVAPTYTGAQVWLNVITFLAEN